MPKQISNNIQRMLCIKYYLRTRLLQQKYKENVNDCGGKQNELKWTTKGKQKGAFAQAYTANAQKRALQVNKVWLHEKI